MVTEDYVSFEIAKLLKEKAFNWECKRMCRVLKNFGPKVYDLPEWITNEDLCNLYQNCEFFTIPTLQMAMKWLRDKHNIAIGITFRKPRRILWEIYKNDEFISGGDSPLSYEDVCGDAIKYAINLI